MMGTLTEGCTSVGRCSWNKVLQNTECPWAELGLAPWGLRENKKFKHQNC